MDLMTSLSQRRSGARRGAHLAEQAIADEKRRQAEVAAQREADIKARREAARAKEVARIKFTAAELKGASHVRDSVGWHAVVRVSAKSVTVATPHSWTERIPLERVLQFVHSGYLVSQRENGERSAE